MNKVMRTVVCTLAGWSVVVPSGPAPCVVSPSCNGAGTWYSGGACKACHDAYKDPYKTKFRTKPAP